MPFSDLQLSDDVLRAVTDAGYTEPTPIQAQAIPYILMGRDILGCAQTGTGKTASFTLPMIDVLAAGRTKARMPRSLIIEPTRELASQVADAFDLYGKYNKLAQALFIGGESMADQLKVLDRGADVLIATPGRLLDVFDRGKLLLNDVRILVIDEADRMLDMGFIPDVERIVSLVNRNRQTLLFSATMPPAIRRLADAFLTNPKEIVVAPPATPAATVAQSLLVIGHAGAGGQKEKREALRRLIEAEEVTTALIFCNRKRDVGVVHRSLQRHGYDAAMLHGDLAQATRTEVLDRFRRGETRLLVCSDVAARGLDIQGVSHVFNFDVPTSAEDYVHRIGRTGRAGRSGRALTVAVPEDGPNVAAIEALIGSAIPRLTLDGLDDAELMARTDKRRRGSGREARPERSDRGRRDRGRGERPRDEPARGVRGKDERPREDKPRDERPRDERPRAERPREERPREERPREERPRAERPRDERAGKPTPARPLAAAESASGRRGRGGARPPREAEAPVLGMGDHVPAFMLREPKLSKKA